MLYDYALQIVLQYTNERQFIDKEPNNDAPAVLERPIFRFGNAQDGGVIVVATQALPDAVPVRPLRIAVINGAPGALSDIPKPIAFFESVSDRDDPDLVWDLGAREVLSRGDVIMRDVTPAAVPGIIDRTSVVAQIKQLSEARLQAVRLQEGGKSYTPAERPVIEASDLLGEYLIVFNIAADGRLQMLKAATNKAQDATWTYRPLVVEPFGADYVVAIASRVRLQDLEDWLWRQDNRPAAGLLPSKLRAAIALDSTLRIGAVGLYTNSQ